MSGLATPLASAAARPRVAPPPSRASRRNARAEAHGDVFGSRASRRADAHRRDVSARVGLSDPGYWEGVTALMTPTVAVDLSPPSLAALAIGGVLVLGHSWESIEASRGWRENGKRGGDAGKKTQTRKENANERARTNAASLLATPNEKRERVNEINVINTGSTIVTQKIMTEAERETAEASARAARVLAVAAARADAEMRVLAAADGDADGDAPAGLGFVARIEVCTNNACAKRGGKEVLSALLLLAETNETRTRVECRRSRCMDACASACVVRVNGAGGLQRHAHVGADEAADIFELATGVVVE